MSDAIAESHKSGIGGGSAAAIIGLSRFKTRHDVLLEILGGAPRKETTPAMFIGKLCEPVLRELYENYMNTIGRVPGDDEVFRHSKHDWLIGHPDWVGYKEPRGAEFKIAGLHTFREWGDPKFCQVPPEYYVQCLHYMIVTGFRKWDLAVLIGTDFKVYPIEFDIKQAKALYAAELDFWTRYVVNKEPLPIDHTESCRHFLSWQFKADTAPLDFATGDTAAMLNRLAEQLKEFEATELNVLELKNKARAAIGERAGLKTDKIECRWEANKNGVRSFRTKIAGDY